MVDVCVCAHTRVIYINVFEHFQALSQLIFVTAHSRFTSDFDVFLDILSMVSFSAIDVKQWHE